MGYRVAPSYANICMNKHGDKLERFTSRLNIVHSTIKFTIEKSITAVNFLDPTVSLENTHLETNLFIKPTDRNNYFPFDWPVSPDM